MELKSNKIIRVRGCSYLLLEPRNEIRVISRTLIKKDILFPRGRGPSTSPELLNEFTVRTRRLEKIDDSDHPFALNDVEVVEDLLYVWSHFLKVAQHIFHDSAPLFMLQCLTR